MDAQGPLLHELADIEALEALGCVGAVHFSRSSEPYGAVRRLQLFRWDMPETSPPRVCACGKTKKKLVITSTHWNSLVLTPQVHGAGCYTPV